MDENSFHLFLRTSSRKGYVRRIRLKGNALRSAGGRTDEVAETLIHGHFWRQTRSGSGR
jgi:hypothetical protein